MHTPPFAPRLASRPAARPGPRRVPAQRGVTLVECCTVLAVTAVLVGSALPDWGAARERQRLLSAAAMMETDLQLARGLAVAHNRPLRLAFPTGAACYVVHTGPTGACRCDAGGGTVCTDGGEPLRTAVVHGVRLASNSASMTFEPVKGTVTPTATIRFVGDSGAAVHAVVNVMGRVRSCSPAPAVAGQPAC